MKLSKFFLIAAVALGLSACKNEGVGLNSEIEKGDAYASFSINLPSSSFSRSAVATDINGAKAKDTYEGTVSEQKVKDVLVVLYGADTKKVEHRWVLAITNDGKGASFAGKDLAPHGKYPTNATFVTAAKKVFSKDYKAAVFLNPTPEVDQLTQVGKPVSELEQAAALTVLQVTPKTGILMSNDQGLVPIAEADLKKTKKAAEKAPKAVNVDRIVAKLLVGAKGNDVKNIKVEKGVQISDLKWVADVTNKKTFWLRKLNALAKKPADANYTAEVLGDKSDRWDRYAEDPNYNDPLDGGNGITADQLLDEFNYISANATKSPDPSSLRNIGFEDELGEYVLENTMQPKAQYEVSTTRVIVKLKYLPKGITGSWVEYQETPFSLEDFKEKVAKAQDPNATDEALGMPVGFVQEVQGKTYDYAKSAAIGDHLKIFIDGICYYRVLVRHFNDTQEPTSMAYGRYGVVRNNIYKIAINSITHPGDPVLPPTPPNDPDDDKKDCAKYISTDITVKPWIVRTQDVDL